MRMIIEPVRSLADLAELISLHQTVFHQELGVALPNLRARSPRSVVHLIARTLPHRKPIGALTVIETTRYRTLHTRHMLAFPDKARVATYTHLAVLPEYRGLNIPLELMREARRSFIEPRGIRYTWLLFDADRAQTSNLCRVLGYRVQPQVVSCEYGKCSVLVRDEVATYSETIELPERVPAMPPTSVIPMVVENARSFAAH
jgi:GNAT superfamily N-acetyltransferase